jgi:hypothetical protein
MDGLVKLTGEDKVKRFLRTLTNQEKIELIEEVQRMVNLKTLDLEKIKEKPSEIEYDLTDDYYY